MHVTELRISGALGVAILLIGYITVPHFVFVYFGQSSLGIGLFLYSIGLFFLYLARGRFVVTTLQLCILAFITASICVSGLGDIGHQLYSLVVLAFIFVCTNNLLSDLASRNDGKVKQIVGITFYILFVVGVLGLVAPFTPGRYAIFYQTVFPFSEPSHYALALGPIACAYMLQLRDKGRLMVPVLVSLMALGYPNATLLAVALLLFAVFSGVWVLVTAGMLIVASAAFVGYEGLERLPQYDYFATRLGLLEGTQVLTNLVYLEGWQQASIAISESHGLGIGFQRFGSESAGDAALLIENLYGEEVSRKDGSNLGFKLVGEFGFLGIALCGVLVFYSAFSLIQLRRMVISRFTSAKYIQALYYSCTYMFVIEVLFRGLSYFNPMLILVVFGMGRISPWPRIRWASRHSPKGELGAAVSR